MTPDGENRLRIVALFILGIGVVAYAVWVTFAPRSALIAPPISANDWDRWRNWLATRGGLVALLVATVTYFKNARTRIEAQPRIVYSTIREIKQYGPGEVFHGLGPDSQSAVDGPGVEVIVGSAGDVRALGHVLRITVAVVNKSKEVIGPVAVQLYERTTGTIYEMSIGTVSVDPESESRFTFTYENPVGTGLRPTSPMITFRDSGGRWWQRRAAEPIQRSTDWEMQRLHAST